MNCPTFKNKKNTILFGGVIQLLYALLFFGLAVLITSSILFLKATDTPPIDTSGILNGIVIYGLFGVLYLVLCIGTFKLKRWARKLTLVFSTMIFLLFLSLIAVTCMIDVMPLAELTPQISTFKALGLPKEDFFRIVKIIISIILSLFFLIPNGLLILFNKGKNAIETFKKYDPKTYWTDQLETPVLFLFFIFAIFSLGTLPLFFTKLTVAFGMILSSWACVLLIFFEALLSAVTAYSCLKQKPHAWKLSLLTMSFVTTAHLFTLPLLNVTKFYERYLEVMPNPQNLTVEQLVKIWEAVNMNTLLIFIGILYLGFTIWARRFFQKEAR